MPLTRSFTQSGWRDLNSRPLDPQRRAQRTPPCPPMPEGVRLSVESGLNTAPDDLSCPAVAGSSLARCSHEGVMSKIT
jgi:hypothetical protein